MNKKQITIGTLIIIILLIIGGLMSLNKNKIPEVTNNQNTPDNNIEAIRSFMAEPNLELGYKRTGKPTNFTIGKWANPSAGEGKMTTVPEFDRSVGFYNQTNINKDCQVYTYEVDIRNSQIVQVQLAGNLPIGTELQNSQSECLKKNAKTVTPVQAKEIAIDYLKRNVVDYEQIKDQFGYNNGQNGIYQWLYEDKNFKLPEGVVSDPYPHPTVRIIITKGGYLMSYINTTGLFK